MILNNIGTLNYYRTKMRTKCHVWGHIYIYMQTSRWIMFSWGGGYLHWKVVWRSVLQSSKTPLAFLKKSCISRPIFANIDKIFSSRDTNFSKYFFLRLDPILSQKISFGDPIFEKLSGTYLPIFFWDCLPQVCFHPLLYCYPFYHV